MARAAQRREALLKDFTATVCGWDAGGLNGGRAPRPRGDAGQARIGVRADPPGNSGGFRFVAAGDAGIETLHARARGARVGCYPGRAGAVSKRSAGGWTLEQLAGTREAFDAASSRSLACTFLCAATCSRWR